MLMVLLFNIYILQINVLFGHPKIHVFLNLLQTVLCLLPKIHNVFLKHFLVSIFFVQQMLSYLDSY